MTTTTLKLARTISTVADVRQWIRDQHEADGFSAHPDDSAEYIGLTGPDAAAFDELWDEAFTVCAAEGADIYGLVLDIQNADTIDDEA